MKKNKLLSYTLSLLLLAFSGTAIKYANIIFSVNFRWLVAGTLFLISFSFCGLFNKIKKREFFLFYILSLWIFFSILWSQESIISFFKASAFFVVCSSCFISSYHLSFKNNITNSLNFMSPLFFLAIFAGFGGFFDKSLVNYNQTGLSYIYSGITRNTNYLGSLSLIGIIIGLSIILRSKKNILRILSSLFTLSLIVICFSTFSRTSIIALFACSPFIFLAITQSKNNAIFYASFISLASVLLVITLNLQTIVFERFILKTEIDQSDYLSATILSSRSETLTQSIEAAKKGAFFGLGFGVSDGSQFGGLTNQNITLDGYSREKSNSLLAGIEEIGAIGTLIYIVFISSVFIRIYQAFKIADKNEKRFLYILLSGILALLVSSLSEAFMLSPGSMQLPIFYSFLGAASGTSRKIINNKYLQFFNKSN